MSNIPTIGPGSQPEENDGSDLDILQLPTGMNSYTAPILPESTEMDGLDAALEVLEELGRRLHAWQPGSPVETLSLGHLDRHNRELVDQVLGEGEVGIVIDAGEPLRIQEAVLAGVWRIQRIDPQGQVVDDAIEIAEIPPQVGASVAATTLDRMEVGDPPAGVVNALPLCSEINEQCTSWKPGSPPHVINLTLLPQTEEDLNFLQRQLGQGAVTILSRGYGNCRISSTATRHVWWVQYFNSQDRNILNSLEITDVPTAACAAPEDLEASAERLDEIMEIYR